MLASRPELPHTLTGAGSDSVWLEYMLIKAKDSDGRPKSGILAIMATASLICEWTDIPPPSQTVRHWRRSVQAIVSKFTTKPIARKAYVDPLTLANWLKSRPPEWKNDKKNFRRMLLLLLVLCRIARPSDICSLFRYDGMWIRNGAGKLIGVNLKSLKFKNDYKMDGHECVMWCCSDERICPVTMLYKYVEDSAGQAAKWTERERERAEELGEPPINTPLIFHYRGFEALGPEAISHDVQNLMEVILGSSQDSLGNKIVAHALRGSVRQFLENKGVPTHIINAVAKWDLTFLQIFYGHVSTPRSLTDVILGILDYLPPRELQSAIQEYGDATAADVEAPEDPVESVVPMEPTEPTRRRNASKANKPRVQLKRGRKAKPTQSAVLDLVSEERANAAESPMDPSAPELQGWGISPAPVLSPVEVSAEQATPKRSTAFEIDLIVSGQSYLQRSARKARSNRSMNRR